MRAALTGVLLMALVGLPRPVASPSPSVRPRLTVTPAVALADTPVSIRVEGAAPGATVTLRSAAVDPEGRSWSGEARFVATSTGEVDPATQAPTSGTYAGVDAMGLLWSMRRTETAGASPMVVPAGVPRAAVQDIFPPPTSFRFAPPTSGSSVVMLDVLDAASRRIAGTTIERLATGPDVVITDVREGGLVGRLYEPRGGRRPAVVVFSGSAGGIQPTYAPVLAGHGYVTFALAYFREDGLPKDLVEIPLEYFQRGLAWLRARPSVDPDRVAVLGLSAGGALVLLLGATYPEAVQGIVALVPSDVVWEGAVRDPAKRGRAALKPERSSWSLHGKPLPFVAKTMTPEMEARLAAGQRITGIELNRPPDPALSREAAIPVERIRAPVLMISSRADGMWPSAIMADRALSRMRAAGSARRVEHLAYDHASHVLPDAWWPPGAGGILGGSPEGTMRAYAAYWPRVLAFLEQSVGVPGQ